ncbi:MAG TPA: DHH family phosphoesterase [Lactovum miscens]|uniref:DHH family phosphoesterase n=1 Tax=Lactovum miscens TaxID=190387 RepID=UPI002ED7B6D4
MKKNNYFPSQTTLISIVLVATLLELLLVFFVNLNIANFLAIVFTNAILLAIVLYAKYKFKIDQQELIDLSNKSAEESLQYTLEALPIAIIKYNPTSYQPEWYNPYSSLIFEGDQELNPDLLMKLVMDFGKHGRPYKINEKSYSVSCDLTRNIIYLQDSTEEVNSKMDLLKRRPIIAIIAIDNYDDVTDSFSDGDKSSINSFIAKFLDKYAKNRSVYLRRLAADRYIIFANYAVLSELMTEKFSPLLDEFRERAAEKKIPLTLSIGVSYGIVDYMTIGKTAMNNLELALIRGGDQVVVKENEDNARAVYFGGNSESRIEKSRTRVRAIASLLNNIISESNQVFIMGHKFPDMDALGASVVMRNFAAGLNKEAFIVYNPEQLQEDTKRAIAMLNDVEGLYPHVLRLNSAKKLKTDNALLIMVDHSKISQTMDKEFFERFDKVVVVDHHRRDDDFPENPLLSYIESGASSATEMAVEILRFQNKSGVKMSSIEASVALAGISVDTKSFTKATTENTFESASFLRNQGADNDLVQKFLATDFETFKQVNEVVLAAEIIDGGIAIALGLPGQAYPKVILAKAADRLLTLQGVKASFTLAVNETNDVIVSARSNGKYNVQTIMEALGGGGHFDSAATQITGKSVNEIKEELIQTIRERESK